MTSFLTLDSLSLSTPDGTPLFRDLTLSVGRERVGLVGRNGSGKSTLLHAIMGDVVPASGSLHRNGTVGMLQQSLDETQDLAGALGVSGTPSYIVGDVMLPGAVGADRLQETIDNIRDCGKGVGS